jgi:hypothetical protein
MIGRRDALVYAHKMDLGGLVPIRCRGALHLYTRDRRLVVMAPRIAASEARARLAAVARAHRLVAGGRIPAVLCEDLDAEIPSVTFDCEVASDQETVIDYVRHGGERVDYRRGSALGQFLMRSLEAVHQVTDPETGRAMCLGSLAPANILIGPDGGMWLFGFGAGPFTDACVAPDVAAGAPATPGADVWSVTIFMRSQIGFVDLPPALERVFRGTPQPSDAELIELLLWSNAAILSSMPSERPNMAAALASMQRVWTILGFEPDGAGLAAWVREAIAGEPARVEGGGAGGIRVGPDGEWLEAAGARHALAARRPLRRVLMALAQARRERTGIALTVEELLAAGWPGEEPLRDAGSNRVYVAISTLRKLGLGKALQRWDGGYRLDPTVSLVEMR